MSCAFIVTGGLGDALLGLIAPTLYQLHNEEPIRIFVNSHQEIVDFINKCTYFQAEKCPERTGGFADPENPLNLPPEFLEKLHKDYDHVYSCFPDALGQAPFAFPWFKYAKSYKDFMRTKVHMKVNQLFTPRNTKIVFIHATSVTLEKNYPLTKLQRLMDMFNKTHYAVELARTSSWKGAPLPFFCMGVYKDIVDRPIEEVVSLMAQADYFIGIDSGLAHIAYHLGLPRVVLQQHFNQPFHLARYHQDPTDDLPLDIPPEVIFTRAMLNIKDPITQAIPAYLNLPPNVNTKQLLYKKYYD